jgi:hypothetical protein
MDHVKSKDLSDLRSLIIISIGAALLLLNLFQ